MGQESVYLVAGCKSWNRRLFEDRLRRWPGRWVYVGAPGELAPAVERHRPRYLFFLHWSWLVPEQVVAERECVGFHMTDLPFGRGGSPLQNLIRQGHRTTMLTALRLTPEMDGGPVYAKRELSLEGGTAEEIYIRAGELAATMIRDIIDRQPIPVPQQGAATAFVRRRPDESEIPELDSLEALFDFVRMLDAEGYPRAFLRHRGFRLELSRAARYDGRVAAEVSITKEENAP